MTRIRCAGRTADQAWAREINADPSWPPSTDPCGWEGELGGGVVDQLDCPNCGGRVQIAEEDQP